MWLVVIAATFMLATLSSGFHLSWNEVGRISRRVTSNSPLCAAPRGRKAKDTKTQHAKPNAQASSSKDESLGRSESEKEKVSGSEASDAIDVGEEFRSALRDCRKTNSPKKLLKIVIESEVQGCLNQNMTVYAFRTLQRMNRSDVSLEAIPIWQRVVEKTSSAQQQQQGLEKIVDEDATTRTKYTSSTAEFVELLPAAIFVRSCGKMQRIDLAESVAQLAGVDVDKLSQFIAASSKKSNTNSDDGPIDWSVLIPTVIMRACKKLLPELIIGYMSKGAYPRAFSAMAIMYELKLPIDLELSKLMMKIFLKESSTSEEARRGLRMLLYLGGLRDNDSIQLMTSSYMRSVDFVKGAVSMETCPEPVCCEAAFIGRSNVGKSSLINMISNRKGLAFTSKTPGKTSEFNYFDAVGRVGLKNEKHRFYLVDLPGVGYAEVSLDLKSSWLVLLKRYVTERDTLRVVFHLVDSRHGLLDADEDCLSLLPVLPEHVQYVVVFTKVDKRSGGVRRDILERLQNEIKQRTDRHIPVLYSSSETREGGAEIWSVLLDSLASEPGKNLYDRQKALPPDEE